MAKVLFAVASMMLLYDASGHLFAALFRWASQSGAEWAAPIWNTYSIMIWPRITNQLLYDAYWAAWHLITLGLFTAAFSLVYA